MTQSHGSATSHERCAADSRVTEEIAESGDPGHVPMPLHETSISAVEMGVFCYTGNSGIGKFRQP